MYNSRLGDELQHIAVVRNYPLSSEPKSAFVNSRTQKPYGAERVPKTELYLCTGTSNDDKRRGIEKLVRELRLPPGSVEVV
jgi:hypothetical protein